MATSLLDDYRDELATALRWKKEGRTKVPADVAGEELAAGRESVPIDEYIEMWQVGVTAMEAGADPAQFIY